MLKGISKLISPELIKILMEMGHGDEIVFADGNFPAASNAKRLVRADGHSVVAMLDAIMPLFPLDYATEYTAVLMQHTLETEPCVWAKYKACLRNQPEGDKLLLELPRQEFYARAKEAYCIVATGESERFANIILRKGIISNL